VRISERNCGTHYSTELFCDNLPPYPPVQTITIAQVLSSGGKEDKRKKSTENCWDWNQSVWLLQRRVVPDDLDMGCVKVVPIGSNTVQRWTQKGI